MGGNVFCGNLQDTHEKDLLYFLDYRHCYIYMLMSYIDVLIKTKNFEKANKLGIINSAIGIDLGGIGIAISKMAIASKKGLCIDLKLKNKISVDQFLFSETQSRILVSLKKNKLAIFKKIFKISDYTIIGKCTGSDVIEFKDSKKIIRGKISDFANSYKQNIKGL